MQRKFLLLFLFLYLSVPAGAVPMSARDVAFAEAEAYLGLLDQQRYVDAWRVSTRYFQSQLSVKKWQQILRTYREPLGKVRARRRILARHLDFFETAPPGIYMQVEFQSTFGRHQRLERLVIHKDSDGRWRVASYQLR